jgi:hypothetical protein
VGLLLVAGTTGAADKKKEPEKVPEKVPEKKKEPEKVPEKVPEKAKPPEKALPKLVPAGRLAGTLQSIGGTSGFLTLRVPIRRLEPNRAAIANLGRQQQGWLRRQALILRNPNPFQRQSQMLALAREVQQAQNNLITVRDSYVEVELQPGDDMKVRTAQPDPGFDEMGNIRKLTPALLKELRGKDNLPYYKAELSDLKEGQSVLVTAMRERGSKELTNKLIATFVVILAQPKQ